MGAGVSAANVADKWLGVLKNTAFSGIANCYVQLHTNANTNAGPGAAGTANVSVETTRKAVTWGTISGSALPATSVTSWTSWPSGANNETISWVSVWDASSAGNFLFSGALAVSKTVNTGDTLTLSTLSVGIGTLAS